MKKYVYSEAKQVVVCGDFARAGRSHNLVGWAVSSREYLDDKLFCISLSTRK